MDGEVPGCGVTEKGAVLDNVDVDVGDRSGVFGGIRGVDFGSDEEGCFCRVKNSEIDEFGVDAVRDVRRRTVRWFTWFLRRRS